MDFGAQDLRKGQREREAGAVLAPLDVSNGLVVNVCPVGEFHAGESA